MNPDSDFPQPSPRDLLEERVTALILGELSEPDAAEIRGIMAMDAGLKTFHDQMAKTIGLVTDTLTKPAESSDATPTPKLKLSNKRREALLAAFECEAERLQKPRRSRRKEAHSKSDKKSQSFLTSAATAPDAEEKIRRPNFNFTLLLQVAAVLALIATLAAMLLPSLARAKYKVGDMAVTSENADSYMTDMSSSRGVTDEEATPSEVPPPSPGVDVLSSARVTTLSGRQSDPTAIDAKSTDVTRVDALNSSVSFSKTDVDLDSAQVVLNARAPARPIFLPGLAESKPNAGNDKMQLAGRGSSSTTWFDNNPPAPTAITATPSSESEPVVELNRNAQFTKGRGVQQGIVTAGKPVTRRLSRFAGENPFVGPDENAVANFDVTTAATDIMSRRTSESAAATESFKELGELEALGRMDGEAKQLGNRSKSLGREPAELAKAAEVKQRFSEREELGQSAAGGLSDARQPAMIAGTKWGVESEVRGLYDDDRKLQHEQKTKQESLSLAGVVALEEGRRSGPDVRFGDELASAKSAPDSAASTFWAVQTPPPPPPPAPPAEPALAKTAVMPADEHFLFAMNEQADSGETRNLRENREQFSEKEPLTVAKNSTIYSFSGSGLVSAEAKESQPKSLSKRGQFGFDSGAQQSNLPASGANPSPDDSPANTPQSPPAMRFFAGVTRDDADGLRYRSKLSNQQSGQQEVSVEDLDVLMDMPAGPKVRTPAPGDLADLGTAAPARPALKKSGVYLPKSELPNITAGTRVAADRASDLAVRLVSPSGNDVLLAENKGEFSTNGFGYNSFSDAAENTASGAIRFVTNQEFAPMPPPPVASDEVNEGILLAGEFSAPGQMILSDEARPAAPISTLRSGGADGAVSVDFESIDAIATAGRELAAKDASGPATPSGGWMYRGRRTVSPSRAPSSPPKEAGAEQVIEERLEADFATVAPQKRRAQPPEQVERQTGRQIAAIALQQSAPQATLEKALKQIADTQAQLQPGSGGGGFGAGQQGGGGGQGGGMPGGGEGPESPPTNDPLAANLRDAFGQPIGAASPLLDAFGLPLSGGDGSEMDLLDAWKRLQEEYSSAERAMSQNANSVQGKLDTLADLRASAEQAIEYTRSKMNAATREAARAEQKAEGAAIKAAQQEAAVWRERSGAAQLTLEQVELATQIATLKNQDSSLQQDPLMDAKPRNLGRLAQDLDSVGESDLAKEIHQVNERFSEMTVGMGGGGSHEESLKAAAERASIAAGLKTVARHKAEAARKKAEEDARKMAEAEAEKKAAEAEKTPPRAKPNPEILTKDNAFSTFSLNVSDVSFKLAAASLEKNEMPAPAGVRSEEFINAFNYRDPAPTGGDKLAFAWERAGDSFAHNRDLIRFSVQTAALGRAGGQPLNIVVLLDNSGSMERADRLRIVRQALRTLAGQMTSNDRISIVAFARTPRLWVNGMQGGDPEALLDRVLTLNPEGGTNLEAALDLGYSVAQTHFLPNGNNRVILLTDGAANLGNVEPEDLKAKAEIHRKRGIALDAFGIGWDGYNDDLLEALTRNADGRYGFLNTPREAAEDFADKLAGSLRVAASNVKAQIEFNPDRVISFRQIGYEKHQLKKEQFRDNTVDAAEIGAAESGTALYSIQVNQQGTGPLGVVRVRFLNPATGAYEEQEWPLAWKKSVPSLTDATPSMRLAGGAAAFAEWLAQSPYAGGVTPAALQSMLAGVADAFPNDQRPRQLEKMIQQARQLSGSAGGP